MISTIQGFAYLIKDVIEEAPIPVMMIALPLTIVFLATVSTATAKLIEVFVSKDGSSGSH